MESRQNLSLLRFYMSPLIDRESHFNCSLCHSMTCYDQHLNVLHHLYFGPSIPHCPHFGTIHSNARTCTARYRASCTRTYVPVRSVLTRRGSWGHDGPSSDYKIVCHFTIFYLTEILLSAYFAWKFCPYRLHRRQVPTCKLASSNSCLLKVVSIYAAVPQFEDTINGRVLTEHTLAMLNHRDLRSRCLFLARVSQIVRQMHLLPCVPTSSQAGL